MRRRKQPRIPKTLLPLSRRISQNAHQGTQYLGDHTIGNPHDQGSRGLAQGTDADREDFGENQPGKRSQADLIKDIAQEQGDHDEMACQIDLKAEPQHNSAESQSGTADEQQWLSADTEILFRAGAFPVADVVRSPAFFPALAEVARQLQDGRSGRRRR